MTAADLLERTRALGIVLTGGGGRLRYEAPPGRLTPDLRAALSAHKAAILDLLEAERLAHRVIVHCRDCQHFVPSPPVYRASGAVWEMPGGCLEGRTNPERRPPIYPFTGWYCDAWTPRSVH